LACKYEENQAGQALFRQYAGSHRQPFERTTKTVNELAAELKLTDNAVRAHLVSLERDALIRQSGIQRGTRKPHFAYELTDEAEHLFPKAYDTLLNQLITALKAKLTPKALKDILRETGRSLAGDFPSGGIWKPGLAKVCWRSKRSEDRRELRKTKESFSFAAEVVR
jgi:DNA-binding MarR family transcriptional regulator